MLTNFKKEKIHILQIIKKKRIGNFACASLGYYGLIPSLDKEGCSRLLYTKEIAKPHLSASARRKQSQNSQNFGNFFLDFGNGPNQ